MVRSLKLDAMAPTGPNIHTATSSVPEVVKGALYDVKFILIWLKTAEIYILK